MLDLKQDEGTEPKSSGCLVTYSGHERKCEGTCIYTHFVLYREIPNKSYLLSVIIIR